MTVFEDLAAFRRIVAGDRDDAPPLTGTDRPFAAATVEEGPGGAGGLMTLELTAAVPVPVVESRLGPARPLPRSPAGGRSLVLFPQTLPEDGQRGATVLAEVEDGNAVRLILRRDELPAEDAADHGP